MEFNKEYFADKVLKAVKHPITTINKTGQGINYAKDQYSKHRRKRFHSQIKKYEKIDTSEGTYVNDIIFQRLKMAKKSEILSICESLKIEYVPKIPLAYLSKIYRQAAGHSIVNITRSDHDLQYKRILIDVADKLKPGMGWTSYKMDDDVTEIEIEDKIVEYMNCRFQKQFEKLSPEKKKRSKEEFRKNLKDMGLNQATINATITALTSGTIAVAAAPAVSSLLFVGTVNWYAIVGGTIYYTMAPTIAQTALAGTGVGLAIALPLAAVTLAGPAYRKTIPTTLRLIAIRKRVENQNSKT